jgi:diguanylate cyclase (GGDEF)-like protein
MNARLERLKDMAIRHRFTLIDLAMISSVVIASSLALWQYDAFPNSSAATKQLIFELDEIFAVTTLGFALFSWSRLRAQKREVRRRRAAEAEARALAFEDTLTGLPNRRQFEGALKTALEALPSADAVHAVMLLDLNGFKRINDMYGHPVGDETLIHTASRLRRAVRDGDLVARFGGDEFAILARHLAGPEAASALAVRVIDALKSPIRTEAGEHRVGTGIGIALLPADGADAETLIRKADVALYRAKSEGRSAFRFFEDEMDRTIQERDRLERELRGAVGTSALRNTYQPQVDLGTGEVIGFEALPTWDHPSLGSIDANRLLAIADSAHLLREVTDDLIARACRDAAVWRASITLSMRVPAQMLKDDTFPLRLVSILDRTGLISGRLELEIPESALVSELDAARKTLAAVHQSGVKIALGQFGTGYSTLYHLRNFHLDTIKLDRSFIQAMSHDPQSATIVRALIGLGRGLGLSVAAEGVQDEVQQALLAEQGCGQGQGTRFGAALSSDEACRLGRHEEPADRSADLQVAL